MSTSSLPETSVALRGLAAFEALKGALALAAAAGLLSLRHTDLRAATEAFLEHHGIPPNHHYPRLLIESVARLTHHNLAQVVSFCVAYAAVRLAEGYGLWKGKAWAEWFATLSAGLYLPFEINHFLSRPSYFSAGIILVNLGLVLYIGSRLSFTLNRHKNER